MDDLKFREVPVDSETGEVKEVFVAAVMPDTNPLIVVQQYGMSTYYKKLDAKLDALKNITEHDLVLLPWGGQFTTDVFRITPDHASSIVKQLV